MYGFGLSELFFIGFVILLLYFGVRAIARGVAEMRANRKLPVETRTVRVVAKRPEVSGGGNYASTSTTYYVTFEDESGTRHELTVGGETYGQIAEGDRGTLWHQGTWYKGFTRTAS